MRKRSFQLFLITILIFTVFVAAFGLSYLRFSSIFFENHVNNITFKENQNNSLQISERLNHDYEYFKTLMETKTNDELNGEAVHVFNQHYVGFGTIEGDGFVYENGIKKTFKETFTNSYFDQDITLFRFSDLFLNETDNNLYVYYRYQNRFGYFDANQYLSDIIINRKYVLTLPNGLVLLNMISDQEVSNLNQFFKDYTKISDDLLANKDYYKISDSIDEKKFVTYSKINSVNNLYYLDTISYSEYFYNINVLSNVVLIGVLLIIALQIITQIFFSYFITSAYRDLELSFYQFSYNTIPIVKINSKGKIIHRNKVFKKSFVEYQKNKFITEVFDTTIPELLRLAPIKAWFNKTITYYSGARIIPVKTSVYSFTLLLYPFLSTDDLEIGETQINSATDLPNLNKFRYDVDEILKGKVQVTGKQAAVVLKIMNLQNVDQMKGTSFVDGLVYKISQRISEIMNNQLDVSLYHSFDNNFLLLYKENDLIDVKEDVRRIIRHFDNEIFVLEYGLHVQLRAGIYAFDYKIERSSALNIYEKAKLACAYTSGSGELAIGVYDVATDLKIKQQEQIARDLDEGIKKGEFELYYQAQYDDELNKVIGFESLLRWNNPKYRRLSPLEYITVAEQSDSILRLGDFIISEAIKGAKQLEKYNLKVSINISPSQLIQAGFVTKFIQVMEKEGVKPYQLKIEVTENVIISSFGGIIPKLIQLRDLGIHIQIDDFGTGQSSLLYLKELPIDGLKIDREFVKNLQSDRYSRAIVSMILALARNLDLDVVAEGVEDSAQFDYLTKRGVRFIQGYYISKPLRLSEAIQVLTEKNMIKNKEVK